MLDQLNKLIIKDSDMPIACELESNRQWQSGELLAQINNLRQKIKAYDAQRWLLHCDSSFEFLCGFLSLLSLKKEVVICANASPDWLNAIAMEFDAILSDTLLSAKEVAQIDFSTVNQTDSDKPVIINFDGSEKICFFTSGSTGKPKAIHKTLRCLTNEVATLERTFGQQLLDSLIIASVSHLHIYGLLFKVLWPYISGRQFINCNIEYPEQIIRFDKQLTGKNNCRPYAFVSSPAFISRLDISLEQTSPLVVFSSGGPLKLSDSHRAERYFGCVPTEVFGSTETGGIGYRQQKREGETWWLFKGLVLAKEDDSVYLQSPHVTLQQTIELDDELTIVNESEFIVAGRKDRVIKLEEKRVSLTEIEQFVNGLPEIEKSIALVLEGKRKFIGCVVQLSPAGQKKMRDSGFSQLVREWKSKMKLRFEAITIPRKWRQVDSFSYNSQGKLQVTELLGLFANEQLNNDGQKTHENS